MINEKLLKNEEKAVFALRTLYKSYGYLPFKMSKFEEYELYIRNKDFLVSDRIITFNDTNGKLLALKPDVTLSIIKNGDDISGYKQKVFYNENVYRVSGSSKSFKEIMQTGLECVGDVDLYDIFEVVSLAAKSLGVISSEYVLEISHLGILNSLLEEINADKLFIRQILKLISEKNTHDITSLLNENSVSQQYSESILKLCKIYGGVDDCLKKLEEIDCVKNSKAFCELKSLCELINDSPLKDNIRLDFSVVNDMNYYNGIVFRGFLNGICEGVLSGGQYDKLMQRVGRKSKAIGFAIYLDLLEALDKKNKTSDVECLVLYNDKTPTKKVVEIVDSLVLEGKTVSAQKSVSAKLSYDNLIDLRKD